MEIPMYSVDLIKQLEENFKPITVTPETPVNEIYFDAGIQYLIRTLQTLIRIEDSGDE